MSSEAIEQLRADLLRKQADLQEHGLESGRLAKSVAELTQMLADTERQVAAHDAAVRRSFLTTTASAVVFSVMGNVVLSGGKRLQTVYDWVAENNWGFLVALLGSMGFAHGAFWFRKKRRLEYGAVETGIAIATIGTSLTEKRDALWHTTALIGAIYLWVRGQDNVEVGREQRQQALRNRSREMRTQLEKLRSEANALDARAEEVRQRFDASYAEFRSICEGSGIPLDTDGHEAELASRPASTTTA